MPLPGHDEREDLMGATAPVRALPIFAEGAGTKEGRKVLAGRRATPRTHSAEAHRRGLGDHAALRSGVPPLRLAGVHALGRASGPPRSALATWSVHLKEIGTREVALIGGQAYLRGGLARDPRRHSWTQRHARDDDDRRTRLRRGARRGGEGGGAVLGQRLDRRETRRRTTGCAGSPARTGRPSPRSGTFARPACTSPSTPRSTG